MASGIRGRMIAQIPAQGTAATLQGTVIGECKRAGIVAGANLIPNVAITANGTNFRTLTLINKGQTGVGTTVIATRSWAATNSVAFDEEAMTLTATLADRIVAEGDILAIGETIAASGLAHGGFTAEVVIDPAD